MSWNDSIRQIKETAAVRCGGVRCGGHRSEIDNYYCVFRCGEPCAYTWAIDEVTGEKVEEMGESGNGRPGFNDCVLLRVKGSGVRDGVLSASESEVSLL